jgi:hypothetical protein
MRTYILLLALVLLSACSDGYHRYRLSMRAEFYRQCAALPYTTVGTVGSPATPDSICAIPTDSLRALKPLR